jgi:uncharacterized protein YcnI
VRRAILTLALLGAAAVPAAAHVEVLPTQAVVQEAQQFTVRVPTERPLPTTAVQVLFPPSVTVYAFADPSQGWRMRVLLTSDGRNRGVEYTGGRIGVGRYQDFTFLGTPTRPGTAVWRSRQTYADGKVKPWTGRPEAPGAVSPETGPTQAGPAASTRILTAAEAAQAAAPAAGGDSDDSSDAGIWLGVIAIGVAALAALGTGLLWSTRPARLPEDDER